MRSPRKCPECARCRGEGIARKGGEEVCPFTELEEVHRQVMGAFSIELEEQGAEEGIS